VPEGEFLALLGPNGAGKTTTIGIITSLVNKTSGSVRVFDYDLDRDLAAAKACLGVVPQEVNFNQFESVESVVINSAGFYGITRDVARVRAEKYLRQLQLWEKRKAIARSLSGGMKRRLMIARALMHEPRLLILDEPTAGVDVEVRRSMRDFLREINEQGVTIILTTHYLEEAEELCRHVAIIDKGKIIENDRMGSVLGKLHLETYVLDLQVPIAAAPQLDGIQATLIDEKTLEVEVVRGRSLNDIFGQLSAAGIVVASLRNKVNRLEELFMRLVSEDAVAGGGA
jgi:ABC-2 type transport system ATP-binding protein